MATLDQNKATLEAQKDQQILAENRELVRRAQTGDPTAVQDLFLKHHEHIYRFIWSRVHDPLQADDLTGEVFLRMLANLMSYQDRGMPFRTWLYQIARNLVIDNHRKHRDVLLIPLEEVEQKPLEGKTTEEILEFSLDIGCVQEALTKIPLDQREVVELRFLAGLSVNEVAQVIDRTILAVKALQHRGLTSLRVSLRQKGLKTDGQG